MLTIEEYEAKRQARYERLIAAAEKASQESQSAWKQADLMASVIPLGQPILVGHYSEQRDRNYRERIHNKMRKGYELYQKAAYYRNRAESANNNHAIFSDDPNATEKLEEKIARLEKRQELMKAANKLVRKNDRAGLLEMGFSETTITKLFTPDFCGRIGFADYEITNNGANIRRLKERLQTVAVRQSQDDREEMHGEVRVEYSPSENRIRIYFPGKPDQSTRDELKRHGYRWAPTNGAWQAYYNANAKWFIESKVKKS